MKWFKHFSDALDDPFIQELIDEFGPSGYLAWFGLLEIIAKENGNKLTGKLDVKPQYMKRKLRISVNKLEQIYKFCSEEVKENLNKTSTKPKLLFNFSSEKWNFNCPKILELKDNYIKDLQATGKKPSKHKEEEGEVEAEEDKKQEEKVEEGPPEKGKGKKNIYTEDFEQWWLIFKGNPEHGKGDKAKAFTPFKKIPKKQYPDLMVGTTNYGNTTNGSYKGHNFLKQEIWKLHIVLQPVQTNQQSEISPWQRNQKNFSGKPLSVLKEERKQKENKDNNIYEIVEVEKVK